MKTVNTDLKYKIISDDADKSNRVPVIIVAAGSSMRMRGIAKQFTEICGIPAIVHTLSAFENSTAISNIIVVTKAEFLLHMQQLAEKYNIKKISDITVGGNTRQESVLKGLECVRNSRYALIHDGARPLVSQQLINRVVCELPHYDCVACGVKVTDTIKSVKSDGTVDKTLDRNTLISVQTPQGVNVEKYLEIAKNADVTAFTDDASVFESAGVSVKIVEGDYANIKITTPGDILTVQNFIEKNGGVL